MANQSVAGVVLELFSDMQGVLRRERVAADFPLSDSSLLVVVARFGFKRVFDADQMMAMPVQTCRAVFISMFFMQGNGSVLYVVVNVCGVSVREAALNGKPLRAVPYVFVTRHG